MNLEDLSRLRQGIYRLAGAGFSYPTEELVAAAGAAPAALDGLGLFEFAFGPPVAEAALALGDARVEDLSRAYVSQFETGVGGPACPPQESSYLADPRTGGVGQLQAELNRLYQAFRLDLPAGSADWSDHIATELEAMARLCAREASGGPGAGAAVEQQRQLLTDHLLRWAPDFCRLVNRSGGHDAFSALARGLESFLAHERQLVPVLSVEYGGHR